MPAASEAGDRHGLTQSAFRGDSHPQPRCACEQSEARKSQENLREDPHAWPWVPGAAVGSTRGGRGAGGGGSEATPGPGTSPAVAASRHPLVIFTRLAVCVRHSDCAHVACSVPSLFLRGTWVLRPCLRNWHHLTQREDKRGGNKPSHFYKGFSVEDQRSLGAHGPTGRSQGYLKAKLLTCR